MYVDKSEENVYINDLEQLSCKIFESKFKSSPNSKRHDQMFHLKQGTDTEFQCDFCNEIFDNKRKLHYHIQNIHKICSLCARIFPNL